ncbi:hypothetical protein AB0F91_42170 [Amycolatopsis sp. NPDC023774]
MTTSTTKPINGRLLIAQLNPIGGPGWARTGGVFSSAVPWPWGR